MIKFLNRIRDRLRRERLADELDRELRFHQHMLERDYITHGLSPVDAAGAARREMGNRTSIREQSRDMWSFISLENPLNDLRHGARALRRSPAFASIAVLMLALGIGATAAIFNVVNGVLLKPLPYGHPEQLVGAWHDFPPMNMTHIQQTASTYFTYQRLARTIDGIALYYDGAANVAEPGGKSEPQRLSAAWISETLIPVLQVAPIRGRNFTHAEDFPKGPNSVIISEGVWRTRFGSDAGVIGKNLDIDGEIYQIVGVMPNRFRFPAADTQLWLPLALDPSGTVHNGFSYNAVARLKSGVSLADAQRDFAAVLPRAIELFPEFAPGFSTAKLFDQAKPTPVLIPMREDVTNGIARTLWMLGAAAALVLLVACANVTNLILVRVDGRQRELAVREALGAGRGRVMMHFVAESALLSSLAAVLGLAMAWIAVRALVSRGPAEIPRLAELGIDATTIGFTFVVAALVTLGCSIVPALRIGRADLSSSLREGGRSGTAGRARRHVRNVLVAAQMALALVVLAGSGLLVRTFQNLNAVRPGFDAGHVSTYWMSLPAARAKSDSAVTRFYTQLTDRVAKLPGVESVGIASRLPLETHGMNQNPFYPENDDSYATKIPPLQLFTTIDAGYFRTMHIPLIAGRSFDRLDRQRADEAILSQQTAQVFFHDSSGIAALGKRFRRLPTGIWYTVIGVVANARDTSLAAPPSQTVYFPEVPSAEKAAPQLSHTMALVVRSTGDAAAMTQAVRAAVAELDHTLPIFDARTMSSVLSGSMAQLRFMLLVLGAAAAVTLVLGAIGLYGVMAYVVTLRTKEIGVRIALGAQPSAVAAMMTGQGLALTAIGLVGGLGMFALIARFLSSFLYGVAPTDPLALGSASLLLVLIATLASWIPARRASRVDPADALRAE